MANSATSSPQRTSTSLRKTNKPLMEKRRRARINDSLSQLKSLVIQSSKKDSSQFNKLEKADILELTVKHLRNLQEQQQHQLAQAIDPSLAGKYQAGFMECANEVMRYVKQSQGFSDDIKSRVIHHLASCLQLSSKTSLVKSAQPSNGTAPNSSVMANGLQTMSAQLANGQIIQIVNSPFQNAKHSNSNQFQGTQPIPIASAGSVNLSVSSASTTIPVIIATDPTTASVKNETSNVRYTQPLHIQIPTVLSPVAIKPKVPQLQKQLQSQVIHRVQTVVPHNLCNPQQQETFVSSSTPSPQPTDITMPSPALATNHKSHIYYTHEDHYTDYTPRSRTYSLTSSASTESELTSPLNLSQSPQYYEHKEINNNFSSSLDNNRIQTSTPDKTSPAYHFARNGLYPSQFPSSNFTSVIVDGRKTVDNHSLKYMHIMDEDRICFRHDGTSSPASSVGEERLWRPW